jgi:hypothetical protein
MRRFGTTVRDMEPAGSETLFRLTAFSICSALLAAACTVTSRRAGSSDSVFLIRTPARDWVAAWS